MLERLTTDKHSCLSVMNMTPVTNVLVHWVKGTKKISVVNKNVTPSNFIIYFISSCEENEVY